MNYKLNHSQAIHICTIICCLIPSTIWASVEVGGIYYDLNTSAKTAAVASNPNNYSGAIDIPASFVYSSSTYNVTNIGLNAFRDCTGLNSVEILNNEIIFDKEVFSFCTGLTSVNFPKSAYIASETFFECSGITFVEIPNDVNSIGDMVFCGCIGLTRVIIPSSVTSIGTGGGPELQWLDLRRNT